MSNENAYQGYWRVYGGFWTLLRSTYFWVAILLTVLGPTLWMPIANKSPEWIGLALDIIPSLLGFALGGMAIMLAFSSGKFLDAIRQKGKTNSYFMKMIASFFHFTVVLCLSMVATFIVRLPVFDFAKPALSALGFFLSVYGILLVLATAASIWHTARIFNAVRDIADAE